MDAEEVSSAEISRRAAMAAHVVRTMLRGHEPNVDTADAVCRALRTRMYIGDGRPAGRLTRGADDQRVEPSQRIRRAIREAVRLRRSLRRAEEDAGITIGTMRRVLLGTRPGVDTADRVCRGLGIRMRLG